jgi:hypothetical protein
MVQLVDGFGVWTDSLVLCLLAFWKLTFLAEANLVSSLRFGVENGWLSSFYSCLIKKVLSSL